jgi:chemotaxis response regulator CheB
MVTVSPLLRDVIRRVTEGRVSIDVVAVIESRDSMTERLRALAPELILLALDGGEDDSIAAALADALPGARVLALSHDAEHLWLHQPGTDRWALSNPSLQVLIAAIRGDLDRGADWI